MTAALYGPRGSRTCSAASSRGEPADSVDPRKRRGWGRAEYESATLGIRDTGHLSALKVIIGAMCMSLVVLGVIVQLHPQAPHGLARRLVHGAVLLSAAAVGMHWILRPWPSYRGALAFVIWADLSIATCATVMAGPAAQLNTTIHMGMVGVFTAFLLGWQVSAAHCAFASAVIAGLTASAVIRGDATLLDLYIYYDPALASVVVLPVIIQAVIEGGRRSIGRANRHAVRDPLTGLFNRRGMQITVQAALTTLVTSTVIAVAVLDVDRFKALNDSRGHDAGDAALQELARQLRGTVRHDGDLVARTGGDEFAIIAYLNTRDELDDFIDRCAQLHAGNAVISTSIGIAWQATGDGHLNLDALLHQADTAMYRAKRGGGNSVVVHEPAAG